jgi:murein L,D-transpeptidase YafK
MGFEPPFSEDSPFSRKEAELLERFLFRTERRFLTLFFLKNFRRLPLKHPVETLMQRRDLLLAFASSTMAIATPSLATPSLILPGQVDGILVRKAKRQMILVRERKTFKRYGIALGFNPIGHKERQGDGRTPEGTYRISLLNPHSRFHLSMKVSYPSVEDRRSAARRGVSPGGDIFIHGSPNRWKRTPQGDWTHGCIAVTNEEMEELWKIVPIGCPITIEA